MLQRGLLAAILTLAAALRGWLLARPVAALDGRALPDDAYIAMEIAKNIGWGQGPRFVDYLTNGFQPLFVWLSAIPFAWTVPAALDPSQLDFHLKLALAISCAFDLGSLWLLAAAVRRGTGDPMAGLFAALVWAIHPAVLRVAVNGLETATAIFLLLCIWNLVLRRPFANSSARRLFGIGLVCGVAAMARIDLLLVGTFFAIESIRSLRSATGGDRSQWLAKNGALASGTLAGYAPWMLYSWGYTGTFVPGSGAAVRWITLTHSQHQLNASFFADMGSNALAAVDGNIPLFGKAALLFVVVAVAATFRRRAADASTPSARSPRWLMLPAVFCGALFCAYTLYVFAPWFFLRYLAPFEVLAIAIVAAGVSRLAALAPRHSRAIWLFAAGVAVLTTTLQPGFRRLLVAPPDSQIGYRNLGLWARHLVAPGTTIGATQTGALAYYASDYRVVNLDGVVNPRAYDAVRTGTAMDYIREEDIDYVIGWRRNLEFLERNSKDFDPADLATVGYIEQFRSWGIQWEIHRVVYPDGRMPPPLGNRR